MAKAKKEGYLSSRESRRISRENRKITNEYEKKRKRKNVPESEYITEMRDPNNAVEFDDLHTYVFTASATEVDFEGFLKVMKLALRKTKADDEEDEDEIVYTEHESELVVGSADEVLDAGFVIDEDSPEDIMDVFGGADSDDDTYED